MKRTSLANLPIAMERTAKRSHPWISRGTGLHHFRTGIGHHLKGGRQDDWTHDQQPAPVPVGSIIEIIRMARDIHLRPPLRSFSSSLASSPVYGGYALAGCSPTSESTRVRTPAINWLLTLIESPLFRKRMTKGGSLPKESSLTPSSPTPAPCPLITSTFA
jgi:hypothetical protein